jgi:hypothetical protein
MEDTIKSLPPLVKYITSIKGDSSVKYADDNTLIVSNAKGCSSINIQADKIIKQFTTTSSHGVMAINTKKQIVALGKYNENTYSCDTLEIYNIVTGNKTCSFTQKSSSIQSLCFGPKDTIFIDSCDSIKMSDTIQNYNYVTNTNDGSIGFSNSLSFAVDLNNSIMCVAERNGEVSVYNTCNLQLPPKTLNLNCAIVGCAINPNGIAAIMHKLNTKISIIDLKQRILSSKTINYPKLERRFGDYLFFLKNLMVVVSTLFDLSDLKEKLDYWDLETLKLVSSVDLTDGQMWDISPTQKEAIIELDGDIKYGIFSISTEINNK